MKKFKLEIEITTTDDLNEEDFFLDKYDVDGFIIGRDNPDLEDPIETFYMEKGEITNITQIE